jgi:hypothetical protein
MLPVTIKPGFCNDAIPRPRPIGPVAAGQAPNSARECSGERSSGTLTCNPCITLRRRSHPRFQHSRRRSPPPTLFATPGGFEIYLSGDVYSPRITEKADLFSLGLRRGCFACRLRLGKCPLISLLWHFRASRAAAGPGRSHERPSFGAGFTLGSENGVGSRRAWSHPWTISSAHASFSPLS